MTTGIFGLLQQPTAHSTRDCWWQGASGKWIITTIYPLTVNQFDGPSVYVMVRRDAEGRAHPLYIGQTSDTARRMGEHLKDKLITAWSLGGNELHLHFLAKTEHDRFTVETDLRNGHVTPINEQSSSVLGGLFGLGAIYQQPQPRKSWLDELSINA